MFERDRFADNTKLVRRHSLSIIDRSPPANSLAFELLAGNRSLAMSTKILSSIADMKETLSDFNSCVESSSDSSGEEDFRKANKSEVPKTINEKKRLKKLKRKLALTPGKDQFMKKPNTHCSPK